MRMLTLLFSSGHTVKIALKPDDMNKDGGPTYEGTSEFLDGLPAIGMVDTGAIVFAHIHDATDDAAAMDRNLADLDYARIVPYGPGEAF